MFFKELKMNDAAEKLKGLGCTGKELMAFDGPDADDECPLSIHLDYYLAKDIHRVVFELKRLAFSGVT